MVGRLPLQKSLQLLIELQEIERKAHDLRREKARTPEQIGALEERVRTAEAGHHQLLEMLEAARKLRRQLEQDVEDLQLRVGRSKQKLLEVKSNKEYQALLKEIDDIEAFIREREDKILEQMEAAEGIRARLKEGERLAEQARERLEKEGARLGKEAEKVDIWLAGLNEQLEKLTPQIPADILKHYHFLKTHRSGIAVAPVNEGTCQICHMNLPPQLFIDLQRDEQLLHCPNCQRIIYWVGHKDYGSSAQVPGEQT
jgi:predicted  nucleic acid-binding Zn-ribbon protein